MKEQIKTEIAEWDEFIAKRPELNGRCGKWPDWCRWQNERIEQLEKALEWYAGEYPYESSPSDDFMFWEQPDVMSDKGKRARQALGRE